MRIKTNLRRTGLISLSLFAIFVIWGCVAYKYIAPYQTFNHESHETALLQNGMDCFSCHKVDVDEKDPLKRLEKLVQMLKESDDKRFTDKELCHKCHRDVLTKRDDAPARCVVCHDNLREILPSDHEGLWKATHGVKAQVSDKICMDCHDKWYCADCHTATDMSETKMHPRTFKIAHVAAAITDPQSCGTCHNSSFCLDCHRR